MKTLEQIFDILEDKNIQIHNYKEDGKLCGYELNTYTDGGVNQNIFLDFRNSDKAPRTPADFIEIFSEYVDSIDIDYEIEINRQNEAYKRDFSLRESLEDFENWKKNMENIVELLQNDTEPDTPVKALQNLLWVLDEQLTEDSKENESIIEAIQRAEKIIQKTEK